MKTQGTTSPDLIRYLQGGIIISFNIVSQERTEMDNTISTYFEYDTIKVSLNPTKGEIVNSMIRCKYSLDEELSLINNYNISLITPNQKSIDEYNVYQEFRNEAKTIADSVLVLIQ